MDMLRTLVQFGHPFNWSCLFQIVKSRSHQKFQRIRNIRDKSLDVIFLRNIIFIQKYLNNLFLIS